MKTKRRKNDQYFTPTKAVNALLDRLDFSLEGNIFEPCSGKWSIVNALFDHPKFDRTQGNIITNDIDPKMGARTHYDMTIEDSWREINKDFNIDWVITNPPFNKAIEILKHAYNYSNKGVILLLRLSFLEPCNNRVDFLEKYPPQRLYITPRISFTGKGTDSVTTAWLVWSYENISKSIEVIRK